MINEENLSLIAGTACNVSNRRSVLSPELSAFELPALILSMEGTILEMNNSFLQLLGYSKQELSGSSDFHIPEMDPNIGLIQKAVFTKRKISFVQLQSISGNMEKCVLIKQKLKNKILLFIVDVEEAENINNLYYSVDMLEDQYNIAFENSNLPIFVYHDRHILYANSAMYKAVDSSSLEMVETCLCRVFSPEYKKKLKNSNSVLNDKIGSQSFEAEIISSREIKKTFDMRQYNIIYQGQSALLVSARDISQEIIQKKEKKYQQRKLDLVNRSLHAIVEYREPLEALHGFMICLTGAFPDYYIELEVVDGENVHIIHLQDNRLHSKKCLFEHSRLAGLQSSVRAEVRVLQENSSYVEDRIFIKNQGEGLVLEVPFVGAHGVIGVCRLSWKADAPIEDQKLIVDLIDEVSGALEALYYRIRINYLRHKQMEEEKNALISKFALIGEMAASIAHEVRNPMTTVRGLAQILLDNNENNREYFELMIEELDRANKLLTDFLSLAKEDDGEFEETKINSIVEKCMNIMHGQLVYNDIKLESKLEQSEGVNVYVDADKLVQTIMNISRNAVEAMQAEGLLEVSSRLDDDKVIVAFKDNGQGMSAGDLQKVMQPFYSTKSTGTGLGLSVSYKNIKDNGGDIHIQSKEGEGSTISIILPIYQGDGSGGIPRGRF